MDELREQSKYRPHLPDCAAVQKGFRVRCDCSRPQHPIRGGKALVRRNGRLHVIPQSKRKVGERDLNGSGLLLEKKARKMIESTQSRRGSIKRGGRA